MSHHVGSMLATHPEKGSSDEGPLARCIEECFSCAAVCTSCADACLSEEMVAELRKCISTDLDCADICLATGRVLMRQTGGNDQTSRSLLEACRNACRSCAEECEKHADMHDHCRICAEACRRCEEACTDLLRTMA